MIDQNDIKMFNNIKQKRGRPKGSTNDSRLSREHRAAWEAKYNPKVSVGDPYEVAVALKFNGYYIMYLDDPTEHEQTVAVRGNPLCIALIKNPCEAAQMIAVTEMDIALHYIKNPCEEAITLHTALYKL